MDKKHLNLKRGRKKKTGGLDKVTKKKISQPEEKPEKKNIGKYK